jgi:peptide deformylase
VGGMSEMHVAHDHEPDRRLALVDPIEHAVQLNSIAEEVSAEEIVGDGTRRIITEMLRIAAGKNDEGVAQMVGLAAPQVGVSKRIAIVDMAATGMREKQSMAVLINPRIIWTSPEIVDGREGCWSCGSYCASVPRATKVTVEFYDEMGILQRKELEDFTARIVQHEIDHLNGVRCIDRVPEGEPWRLHRVDLGNAGEFDRYRTEWPHWQKTFPREEWDRFRNGDTV